MEFKSILFADTDIETEKTPPAFFKDLKLDYILNIINHMAGDYQINQYYYTMPGNIPLIQYRQQVFCDLMDKGLCQAVYAFCAGMRKSRHSYMLSLECGEKVRQAGYHLEAALFYWETLDKFRQELNNLSPASYGIRLLKEYVLKHVKDCQENGFSSAAAGAREIFSKMRFYMSVNKSGITITGVKDTGTEDTEEIPVKKNYLKELSVLLQAGVTDSKTYLNDIFPNVLEPSYLEIALIKLLKRSQPEVFVKIQEFYKNYPGFYSEKLLRFEEEVQFYLAFLNFMDKAGTHGCTLNIPEVSNNCRFSGSGVYDIALVFKSAGREQKVVPNDFSFNKEPSFFVVTGPNQGGKTTFARSLGQAAYFSGMGMPANAASLKIPLFNGISTHFEAEEKIQSNSGKLKEEIDRLAPMMKQDKNNHFIILNELFTTATTNDALVMGKKVMEHFLKAGCYGIYVTHIQELAKETERVISLVAQIEDSGNGDKKRTYRMAHMEAEGYGYTESLVNEAGLSYESIVKLLQQNWR